MKNIYFIGALFLSTAVFTACGGDKNEDNSQEKPTAEAIKMSITSMEDSLKMMQKSGKKVENLYRIELINRLLSFYHNYPENEYAAECLDKTQMIYSAIEATSYSIAYSDTLLEKYPNYKNRELILESQGANYDVFLIPRDSLMVRKYYTMLLKEFPNMDKDKREGILKRLRSNNLSFDEYITTL
jgi:hypothetical protein